jgi:hypothetical protein
VSLSQSTAAMFFCPRFFYFSFAHATVSNIFTVSVLEFLICALETTADSNNVIANQPVIDFIL